MTGMKFRVPVTPLFLRSWKSINGSILRFVDRLSSIHHQLALLKNSDPNKRVYWVLYDDFERAIIYHRPSILVEDTIFCEIFPLG